MLENSIRNQRLLAGVAGVTLALGLAVSAGAVPRLNGEGAVRTAAVSQIEEVAAPVARQPGDSAAPQATTSTTATASAPTTAAAPKVTAPPTTKAPVARTTATTRPAAAVATVAPVITAPAPPAVTKVARTTPTSAQAQAAIAEMKSRVGGLAALATISEAQLADAGNQVCTAFDNGQTFAQVKATGLTMIPAFITVTPPTVDWAVRQGVAMYCPGHSNKLV